MVEGRGKGALWVSSYEDTNPSHVGRTLMIQAPPEGLTS